MAWKASGTATEGTPVEIPSTKPITTPGAKAQYAASLNAATILCAQGLGGALAESDIITVDMQGNGEAYPTARVTITISQETTNTGTSFSGKAHCNNAADVAKIIPLGTVSPVVWSALVSAAQELITNGMIGNIRPYEVRLSAETSGPTAMATVEVQRPVAEGYAN